MSQQLFTVEQVAQSLNLHVRTIRNYVRAGRLKAARIGKQYRIARSDLDAFTGGSGPAINERALGMCGRIEVTSVVQIEGISQHSASRLTGLLTGAAKAYRSDAGSLNVSTVYDEERDCLRVVLVSSDLRATTDVIGMIAAIGNLRSTGEA
jgi:excisionase family DNA binding protein